jgi:hypothetical protein
MCVRLRVVHVTQGHTPRSSSTTACILALSLQEKRSYRNPGTFLSSPARGMCLACGNCVFAVLLFFGILSIGWFGWKGGGVTHCGIAK